MKFTEAKLEKAANLYHTFTYVVSVLFTMLFNFGSALLISSVLLHSSLPSSAERNIPNESPNSDHRALMALMAEWGPVMNTTVGPASAANLPGGKVLMWAARSKTTFGGNKEGTGKTWTTIYDPKEGTFSDELVVDTGHDMFCPGKWEDVFV